MSNFEYLGQVTIGQYLPGDSIIHRLDPRARLLFFFCLIAAITFAVRPAGLLLGLAVVLVCLVIAHIPLKYALGGLLPPLPFLLILAGFQVFLFGHDANSVVLLQIGPISLTNTGLWAGAVLLLRFAGLILALSLASFCLSTSQIIHGLDSLLKPLARIRFPSRDLIMIIQITLRFLPLLALSAERIAKSQASRGAEWGVGRGSLMQRARQIIPLIVPLFMTSLHRAELMALAMDARAYGSSPRPTSMVDMHFQVVDALAVALGIIIAAAILII
jgi:energy-coupling factor transport system permease protein